MGDEEESTGLWRGIVSPQGQGLVTSPACTRPVGHHRDALLASAGGKSYHINTRSFGTRIREDLIFFSITRSEEMSNTC